MSSYNFREVKEKIFKKKVHDDKLDYHQRHALRQHKKDTVMFPTTK
jgi:hypothetical protein